MQLRTDDESLLRAVFPESTPRPRHIGIAVSGGGDSIALLHLHAMQWLPDAQISVATVNHGLRPEAAEECLFVAGECAKLGISHTTLQWVGWEGTGNLQAEARRARYALLAKWAHARGCDFVCLGHTLNDVAENFLIRLKRAAGLDGLAAMEARFERNNTWFTRPLLGHSRDDLRAFLSRHSLSWREDPSNEDQSYDRVKARKVIENLAPLGLGKEVLAGVSTHLLEAKRSLEVGRVDLMRRALRFELGDVLIDANVFDAATDEQRHHVISTILTWLGGTYYPPRASSVQKWSTSHQYGLPYMLHGCAVVHSDHEIRISREPNAIKNIVTPTNVVWDGRWKFDGPHSADLEVRVLGEQGLSECGGWRELSLPRLSLLAAPAIWRGTELMASPLTNVNPDWTATLVRDQKHFFSYRVPH